MSGECAPSFATSAAVGIALTPASGRDFATIGGAGVTGFAVTSALCGLTPTTTSALPVGSIRIDAVSQPPAP